MESSRNIPYCLVGACPRFNIFILIIVLCIFINLRMSSGLDFWAQGCISWAFLFALLIAQQIKLGIFLKNLAWGSPLQHF